MKSVEFLLGILTIAVNIYEKPPKKTLPWLPILSFTQVKVGTVLESVLIFTVVNYFLKARIIFGACPHIVVVLFF